MKLMWLPMVALIAVAVIAEDLPPPVAEQVKTQAPNATVTRVSQRNRNGLPQYRVYVEFADKRKGRIETALDGALVKLSLELDEASLPAAVSKAAHALYPKAAFFSAEKTQAAPDNPEYRVVFQDKTLTLESVFSAEGKMLSRSDEMDPAALPAPALERVRKEKPAGKITSARLINDGHDEYYSLRVETHYSLSLPDPAGSRTEIHKVKTDALPSALRAVAEKELGADLADAQFVQKTVTPATVYETEVSYRSRLNILPDGTLMQRKVAANGQNPQNNAVRPPAPPPEKF